jgi:hypothetical protein
MTASLERWPDVLRWMPESVREAIPIVAWRRDVLWSLALPVEHILVADLIWLLDLPCWATGGIPFQVSPNAVREEPNRYPDHFRRAMASDLDEAIRLTWYNGRWTILDGIHRLLKAAILGWESLPAKKLTAADFQRIVEPTDGT